MDTALLAKAITKALLVLLFLAVSSLSLFFAPELTWNALVFALLKGLLAAVFGGVFLFIVADTVVKSIMSSALAARASRHEGGLLYHFLKPDPGELPGAEEESALTGVKGGTGAKERK